MKTRFPIFAFDARSLLCLAAMIGAGVPCFGQLRFSLSLIETNLTAAADHQSGARATEQKAIQQGEPIAVRLELINDGPSAVQIQATLDPAAGYVQLFLTHDEADAARFTVNRWEIKDILVKPRSLAPGAKMVHETFLYGKMGSDYKDRYLFDGEGKCLIQAVFASQTPLVRLESNAVTVTVGPPVPDWKELQAAGIVELMEGRLRSRSEVTNTLARIESLVSAQASHPLAKWVAAKDTAFRGPKTQR